MADPTTKKCSREKAITRILCSVFQGLERRCNALIAGLHALRNPVHRLHSSGEVCDGCDWRSTARTTCLSTSQGQGRRATRPAANVTRASGRRRGWLVRAVAEPDRAVGRDPADRRTGPATTPRPNLGTVPPIGGHSPRPALAPDRQGRLDRTYIDTIGSSQTEPTSRRWAFRTIRLT